MKTPLTLIKGNAELLGRRGSMLAESDGAQSLVDIAQSAGRLERIIDDLLVLARLNEGQALDREAVRLAGRRAARRSRARARASAPAHRRARRRRPRAGVRLAVGAARGVDDVLSNAEKHSPRDEPIEAIVEERDGRAFVTVRDHGQGFGPDQAERSSRRSTARRARRASRPALASD